MRTQRVWMATTAGVALGALTLLAAPQGPATAPGTAERGGPGQPGEMRGGQGGMRRPPSPIPSPEQLAKAGVGEEQIKAVTQFGFEQQKQRIDLQATAEKAQLTLEQLMQASPVDEKAILQAVDALNQAHGALFKLEIVTRLKVKQLLGEETLRKLHEQGPQDRPVPPGREPGQAGQGQSPQDNDPRPPPPQGE